MKMIKTRLRNCLKERSLSFLMKIAIESPEKLSVKILDDIIDIWNRKPRRIVAQNCDCCSTIEFLTLVYNLYLSYIIIKS